jgi:hypothetical protein
MGGGGGGSSSSYFPSDPTKLQDLIRQTREGTEQLRLDADVNTYLEQLLIRLNERNPEKTQAYLDEVMNVLGDYHEIERLLFGGSVAKHTYVDGLSDIDALVVLQRADLQGKTPQEVLKIFFDSLEAQMTHDKVADLTQGKLAVTIDYQDGTQIQLLPAVRRGRDICIADANGTDWKTINPKIFHRELSRANERLNRVLVPTIKIAKSVLSGLPEDLRPTGYHVESICLDVTKGYRGPKTVKSLLLHVMTAAASRVLRPIRDLTNQSRNVDDYLGRPQSEARVKLSRAVAGIARRINAAATVDRWKEIVEG